MSPTIHISKFISGPQTYYIFNLFTTALCPKYLIEYEIQFPLCCVCTHGNEGCNLAS